MPNKPQRVLLVSFDLQTSDEQFKERVANLWNVFAQSEDWWHFLTFAWLVATSDTASEFYNKLAPCLRAGDRMLIVEVTQHYWGTLPKEAWDWIYKYIGKTTVGAVVAGQRP